jgi:hypothetical protein
VGGIRGQAIGVRFRGKISFNTILIFGDSTSIRIGGGVFGRSKCFIMAHYSDLKLFTGFPVADLMDSKLMVTKAMARATAPAHAKTNHSTEIL